MNERGDLRIGDFSRLAQLSIRVLRHYDSIGLLVPSRVDPDNGYRYYSPSQLGDAHRIAILKSLGLGLGEITNLLHDDPSNDEILGILRLKHAEAETARATAEGRLAELDRQMTVLRSTGRMADLDVALHRVAPAPFLALRTTFGDVDAATEAVALVRRAVTTTGAALAGPVVVVGYDDSHRDTDLDLEIGVLCDHDEPIQLGQDLELEPRVLAGCETMASIMTSGDPEVEHDRALRVLGDWLVATGRHLAGPGREILHASTDHDAGFVLQLQYPTAPD